MARNVSGSKQFSTDFVVADATKPLQTWDEIFAILILAGWTAVDWSNGAVVAAGLGTEPGFTAGIYAWQRLRAPTGAMEMIWQWGTGRALWNVEVCDDGYNNDGAPTTRPTAVAGSQALTLVGNSPTNYVTMSSTTVATDYKWQICADSVPSASGYYYFHVLGRITGTGVKWRRIALSGLRAGTYSPSDIAPWAALVTTGAATTLLSNHGWGGWYKKGGVGAKTMITLTGDQDGRFPSLGVTDPISGAHQFLRPMLCDTAGTELQQKGRPVDFFWPASSQSALPDGDTLNLATAWGIVSDGDPGAVYRWDDGLFPWPHGVPPVI